MFAARALRRAPVQVTLLDRAEHHLFQPMLYQYSTGILSEGKIAFPLRELLRKLRNVELILAEVTGIDADGRDGYWRGARWASRSSSATTTSSWPPASGSPISGTTSTPPSRPG